ERGGGGWGIPERSPIPTSPSQRSALGPSLSPLKGGEGFLVSARANGQAASPLRLPAMRRRFAEMDGAVRGLRCLEQPRRGGAAQRSAKEPRPRHKPPRRPSN